MFKFFEGFVGEDAEEVVVVSFGGFEEVVGKERRASVFGVAQIGAFPHFGTHGATFCIDVSLSLIFGGESAGVGEFEVADFDSTDFGEDFVEQAFLDGLGEGDGVKREAVVGVFGDEFVEEGRFIVVVSREDNQWESPSGAWFGGFEEGFLVVVFIELIDDDFFAATDDGTGVRGDDFDFFAAFELQAVEGVLVNHLAEVGEDF